MRIVRTIAEFPANDSIQTGFVPTLGALHEGHLSLIERSKRENQRTVVSIFVNPTQFGPNEDFSKYPRPFERDCDLAAAAGADIVFAPLVDEMYGDQDCSIVVPGVTELFEGALRPGHFNAVATVVIKLFNIVSPKTAYFGEKDLQQCAVVRKLVSDLKLALSLVICETVREPSGLAKSSRNAYLSSNEAAAAPLLYQTLRKAKDDILIGKNVESVLKQSASFLSSNSFLVDYFALVDRSLMIPLTSPNDFASLIVAAKIGSTRLIDNVRVVG